jgi:hypothetical protein
MTAEKKPTRRKLTEEETDTIVETQATDNSAWQKPIQVRKRKSAAVSMTKEFADRARLLFKKRGPRSGRLKIAHRFMVWDQTEDGHAVREADG